MFHLGNNGRGKQYVPCPRRPPGGLAAMTHTGGDEGLDKSQHEGALALFSYLRGGAPTWRASATTKALGTVSGVTFVTETGAKTRSPLNLKVDRVPPSGGPKSRH